MVSRTFARAGVNSHRVADLSFGVAALIIGCVGGIASAHSAKLGVAAFAGLLTIILVARKPVYLAILALVGVFFVQRLGGTSINAGSNGGLSYSDALMAAAAFMSLPALTGTPELRRLKIAGYGLAAYLVCLLPGIIVHPSHRSYQEWAHRLVLVGGAMVVGAWIVQEGKATLALRWFAGIAGLIGLLTIESSIRTGFGTVSPLGLNKNFVGAQLGAAVVVLIVTRRSIALPRRLWWTVFVIVAAGFLLAQSRGAEIGVAFGLLLAFLFEDREHSAGSKVISVFVAILLAVAAYISITDQLNHTSQADRNTSSLGVRFNVEKETRKIWRTSPIVGVGLKYFNGGGYGFYAQAPNNVEDNELAESGVVGLAGFALMQLAVFLAVIRRRRGEPLALAGLALVGGILLHGQVDIYWTAGVVALPFVILGMGLASSRDPDLRRYRPRRRRVSRRSHRRSASPHYV